MERCRRCSLVHGRRSFRRAPAKRSVAIEAGHAVAGGITAAIDWRRLLDPVEGRLSERSLLAAFALRVPELPRPRQLELE